MSEINTDQFNDTAVIKKLKQKQTSEEEKEQKHTRG